MARPVTLFTGQWADLPLKELAKKAAGFGYEGLELACWGDHMEVDKAAVDKDYCKKQLEILQKNDLKVFAISNHLAGQLVCDLNDDRSDAFAPADCAGDPEKKRAWAVEAMKNTAKAAKNLGVGVVNGFTGSSIWHYLYSFPPVTDEMVEAMKNTAKAAKNLGIGTVNGFTGSSIWHYLYSFPPVTDEMVEEGFAYFAKMWNPILDVFDECGVKFALEVHPTEIAFDTITAKRALEAIGNRETFGFNFDPSHLLWQMVDPAAFIREFPDRIYHVHMKDAALQLNGRTGIISSHLNFGHQDRGWDFRSLGHGDVNFEEIIRALNHAGYTGPLSVEWEDSGMERDHGAKEACDFVKSVDFAPSNIAFDAAFDEENR